MTDPLNPYAAAYSYANLNGPGDARPTALQVLRDNDLLGKWTGRVAFVTGGTAGIGLETARALHATGADVYFTGRDLKKGQAVADEILKDSPGSGKLEPIVMDMDSLDSVKEAARTFLAKSDRLNVLVNNAGTLPHSATNSSPLQKS